jgi:tRNA A-37 threonylcarbamoyl transferase component Bud32
LPGSSLFDYLDSFFSQSKPFEVNGFKYVLKNYTREAGIVKWMVVRSASSVFRVYPYVSDPFKRMEREVEFLRASLPGVQKPAIIIADWKGISIVREYVEGNIVSPLDPATYREVGRLLASIHSGGYALGDAKYYNFLAGEKSTYIIDGEQALHTDNPRHKAWDIGVFLITASYGFINAKSILQPKRYLNYVDEMLSSYREVNPDYMEVFSGFKSLLIRNIATLLTPPPLNALLIMKLIGWAKRKK